MLRSAIYLFSLRKLPWSNFDFPRWQAWVALLLTNLLLGFCMLASKGLADARLTPMMLLGIQLGSTVLVMLIYYPVTRTMQRWMQRGRRWDGRGNMFNLLVTSSLVTEMLCVGLVALDMPVGLIFALRLYGTWVVINALSGAIPKASLSYSAGGFMVCLVTYVIWMVFGALLIGVVIGLGFSSFI